MKKFDKFCESIVNEIECGKNKEATIVSDNVDAIQQLYNKGFAGKDLWYELNEDGTVYIQGPPELVDSFLNTITGLGVEFQVATDGDQEVV